MKTKLPSKFLIKAKQQLVAVACLFCFLPTICVGQDSNICIDAILDFSQNGINWPVNQTNGSFTVENQQFQISIEDHDDILQDVEEAGAGLMIGTNPHSVHDYVSIIYQLSQSTSNVQFAISDLDYKNYGYNNSNQQEAVCVYGYCKGKKVLPQITSIDGSVHISDNCAQATKDSKKGHEESIQITFNECIDKIEIQYGTGNNSPVHNPTYGKIYIGEVGGVLASTCNNNCESCEDLCTEATLDFSEHGYDWHKNSTSGNYTIEDQNIQITVEDPDGILEDTSEEGASLKIGIDPHTVDDVVNIRYQLSETSDQVKFIIRDLDYKHYGAHSSNQQEKVCVYGYRNGDDVFPKISLVEGSVKIQGNCAEAMDDSKNGHDESIEICFEECIDEVLIVYGNGPKTPVSNPTYSKIYIGDHYGFLTNYCEDTCIDCQLVVDTGDDQSICSNDAIEINASVDGISDCSDGANEVTYLWSTGETSPSITVTESGTYSVTVTDCNGCEATDEVNISITPDPEANAGEDTLICEGETVTLTATGGLEYTWSNGETGSTINVNPTTTTIYTVTVNNGNGCEASDDVTVTVAENPTANAGEDVPICAGESVNLSATGGTSYLWDNGSTDASINLQPTETITYSVTVTSGDGCIGIDDVTVTVNPNPEIQVESAVICEGQTATLLATSFAVDAVNFEWSNGETTAEITVNPAETIDYAVTITDANGCNNATSATVTVNPNPIVTVENTEICVGQAADLSATGFAIGAVSFTWDNGETTPDITVSPSETSNFTVTITDSNSCENTAAAIVTVNPNPSITVNDAVICVGEEATLTAEGGATYSWDPVFSGQILLASPDISTTYTVTGTDQNGCSNVAIAAVTVNTNPLATVNDVAICEGQAATLTATGGTSYTWDSGDNTDEIIVAPITTTTYSVTVTDANSCRDTASATVTVNPNPIASVNDETVCDGQSATLTATGGTSYVWDTGENTGEIIITPNATTTYTVTVTDDNSCSNTASGTVNVNPNPTVNVNDAAVCEGQTATLTATGGTSFVWGNGENTDEIMVTPNATTTYTVTVTDDNSCSNTASGTVTLNPGPTATVNSEVICEGEDALLTASGGTSYVWDSGANGATIAVSPNATLDFIVTVTDDNGCIDMATATVTVNPSPAAAIGDVAACDGEPATLKATGGTSYLWESGETSDSITLDPAVAGTYTVTVSNDSGCSAVAQGNVTVNSSPVVSIAAGQTEICGGESVTLMASGAEDYLWDNGETTASISVTPNAATTYSVTGTSLGCPASFEVTIDVTDITLGRLLIDSVSCRVPTSSESIKATISEESKFEDGYAKYYILAYGEDDVIVEYQLAFTTTSTPKFNVAAAQDGFYSIHTFIADTTVFDVETYMDDAIANGRKIDDVYMLTIEGGGDLCAKIDREGAQTELRACLKLGSTIEESFEVYPNPASETLYFRNISLDNLTALELSNIEGKVIDHFTFLDNEQLLSLSVKDYPTGIYLLKATTALKTHTVKVVIR